MIANLTKIRFLRQVLGILHTSQKKPPPKVYRYSITVP